MPSKTGKWFSGGRLGIIKPDAGSGYFSIDGSNTQTDVTKTFSNGQRISYDFYHGPEGVEVSNIQPLSEGAAGKENTVGSRADLQLHSPRQESSTGNVEMPTSPLEMWLRTPQMHEQLGVMMSSLAPDASERLSNRFGFFRHSFHENNS